jgi:Arc/MetJ family transcription regulator
MLMRTNIVIDDQLMEAAMKAGGFKTKRDAVEEGLRLLARRAAYQNIRALRGKLHWGLDGDWAAADASAHTVQEPAGPWHAGEAASGGARTAAAPTAARKPASPSGARGRKGAR